MRKNAKYGALLLIAALLLSLLGCGGSKDEFDPINDMKAIVFDEYGSQKVGKAVDTMMPDAEWSFGKDPDGDGVMEHFVTAAGTAEGSELSLNFKLTYKYRQMKNDPIEYEAWLDSVVLDGEYIDDPDFLSFVLYWLYGNDVDGLLED